MTRLHEPLEQHIHGQLCHEVNEFIINMKIHYMDITNEPSEQQEKIIEARRRKPKPTSEQVIQMLTKCHDELNKCTKPFKRF